MEGITQRLGSIVLDQNDEEEADFIGWSAIAAQATQDAIAQTSELQSKLEEQRHMFEKLNKQLDELVKAKEEHENDLLRKFTELLNSKKRKIRDQQRLLAGAKVDATTAEQVSSIRNGGSTGKGKRKASAAEEDGKMELDEEDDESEAIPIETPEAMDDETASDDDDEAQPVPLKTTGKSKGTDKEADEEMTDIPPRRELPFKRTTRQSQPQQDAPAASSSLTEGHSQRAEPAEAAGDDEDDETDDEL